MKSYSKTTLFIILLFLIGVRLNYVQWGAEKAVNVITWDAFGYYLILPGLVIYDDIRQMAWIAEVNSKYQVTGDIYQVGELPNGNKVMKYLLGISILYSPFFLIGHIAAGMTGYLQDGFSQPYQIMICIAALCYAFLGLFVLRKILLRYYSDIVTAVTLVLVTLATNYVQYVSVDSGQSHGYLFTLYALLIAATIRWYERPTPWMALVIGCIIGLGTISRPTEIIMVFIPLMYGLQDVVSRKHKWALVLAHRSHIFFVGLGAFFAGFPQLLYWKAVTDHWIHEIGSRWVFFKPNWQVLFGWEKGWFIYTPVVILMVLGLIYFRKHPLYRSVLIFFILNTWIVIAWYDWRYGASYSTRALVQSYAVMALPMAMMVQQLLKAKLKYFILAAFVFFTFLNLFQVWQYNKTILHYDDMNRRYYQAIFLNPSPTPLQMSLLDTKEFLRKPEQYTKIGTMRIDSQFMIHAHVNPSVKLWESTLEAMESFQTGTEHWLLVHAEVLSSWGAFETFLTTQLVYDDQTKMTRCRMQNGISRPQEWNTVEYYFKIPSDTEHGTLSILAETGVMQEIFIRNVRVECFRKGKG